MTDKEFLGLFNNIDDKYLDEARRDLTASHKCVEMICEEKRHRFGGFSTLAACAAVALAVLLLVSSFIGSYRLATPSDQTVPDTQGSSGQFSANAAPGVSSDGSQLSENAKFYISSSSLSFPVHGKEEDSRVFVNPFYESDPTTATLTFTTRYEGAPADEEIPMRLYLFADGEPLRFTNRYRTQTESLSRTFILEPDKKYALDVSFSVDESVNTVTFLCVVFPGDKDRQTVFYETARNGIFNGELPERADTGEYVPAAEVKNPLENLSVDNVPITERPDVKIYANGKYEDAPIPADSVYINAYLRGGDTYYLMALIDGKPAAVFDGSSVCIVDCKDGTEGFQYKVSEDFLTRNGEHTIQAIVFTASSYEHWHCFGLQSDVRTLSGTDM